LYCPTPAVCSVIVLPHTGSVFCYCTAPHRQYVLSLYCLTPVSESPRVVARLSLNEQIPVAFMKQNCILFICLFAYYLFGNVVGVLDYVGLIGEMTCEYLI